MNVIFFLSIHQIEFVNGDKFKVALSLVNICATIIEKMDQNVEQNMEFNTSKRTIEKIRNDLQSWCKKSFPKSKQNSKNDNDNQMQVSKDPPLAKKDDVVSQESNVENNDDEEEEDIDVEMVEKEKKDVEKE